MDYSKDQVWSVVWENTRFDTSVLTTLQQYGAEKYFAKKHAMVNIPDHIRIESLSAAQDVGKFLSEGAGAIASATA